MFYLYFLLNQSNRRAEALETALRQHLEEAKEKEASQEQHPKKQTKPEGKWKEKVQQLQTEIANLRSRNARIQSLTARIHELEAEAQQLKQSLKKAQDMDERRLKETKAWRSR